MGGDGLLCFLGCTLYCLLYNTELNVSTTQVIEVEREYDRIHFSCYTVGVQPNVHVYSS